MVQESTQADQAVIAEGVDDEPVEDNRRLFSGWRMQAVAGFAAFYALFHMAALNGVSISDYTGITVPLLPQFPMETWNFRVVHIAGALALGFVVYNAMLFSDSDDDAQGGIWGKIAYVLFLPALLALGTGLYFARLIASGTLPEMGGLTTWPAFAGTPIYSQEIWYFGVPLLVATGGGIVLGWLEKAPRDRFRVSDVLLALCGIAVAIYLIAIYGTAARNSVGTPFVPIGVAFAATAGSALILELTRRVAGLALVIITGVFLLYTFVAHLLPGILAVQSAYSWQRFFGHVYSDAGILGPTTAVSSTYIILFIIFAAFLQASKVGDYFVNFAFAAAGRARGGPAKVAIFASGLMGMINGTSAGNVVATGSLTIPLMKKVGYRSTTAGAVEAAASTGGQIMPPIMGAGAFIMAEITGIPYQEIAIAAIIPAILYFMSIYFMVDFEAAKLGMRGMREDELPKLNKLVRQVYLFIPIIILIVALFMGYSVIRSRDTRDGGRRHGQLADAFPDDLARHCQGVRAGGDHVDPDHRGLRLCGHHRGCDLTHRGRRSLFRGVAGPGRCEPASGAVLCHVHRDPFGDGHADHGGLCRGRIGCRTGSCAAWHPDADSAFLRVLLCGSVGHHTPRGAGQLCGGGDLGCEPDGDLGRLVQDRDFRLRGAVHVLLQLGASDGRHLGRGHPGGRHGNLRRVPSVRRGAGLVHGPTRGMVHSVGSVGGGASDDRGRSGDRSGRHRCSRGGVAGTKAVPA